MVWLQILRNKYLIGGIVVIASIVALYYYGKHTGGQQAEIKQAVETVKVINKTRKSYDRIDKETPTNGNRDVGIKWLSKYTVGD